MTEQTPQQGAEPVVLSDANQDAEKLWQEFEEAETGKTTSADDAGAGADDFGIPDDDGEDPAQPNPDPATAGQDGGAADDVWKDAPPAAREAYEKLEREKKQLEHERRSHEGRTAARMKRIDELTRELESLNNKPDAADSNPLNALAEDYPEISKVIETVAAKADKVEAAHKSRLEAELSAEQAAYKETVEREKSLLVEQHPDWLDVLTSNGAAFTQWVDDQPKRVRSVFEQNFKDIVDGQAVAELVSAFKAHLNPPAPEPEPKPSPNASRRERQIGASASPGGTMRKPVVSGIPEEGDPQAIWDQFEAEEQRKANR
jgi:hypothetical protein